MSLRSGAPYADRIEEGGSVLIYEGHDVPRRRTGPDPKTLDQELTTPLGRSTQNGLFFDAAKCHQRGVVPGERVRVYEKVRTGVWVFTGEFNLVDAWREESNGRRVYKFKLCIVQSEWPQDVRETRIEHTRVIPTAVKLAVWKRDGGKCVVCGSRENLHFDHVIPYSLGGSSLVAENIQVLCARHNLEKRNAVG